MTAPLFQSQSPPVSLYLDQSLPYIILFGGLFAFLRKKSKMSLIGSGSVALLWYNRMVNPLCGYLAGFLLLGMGVGRVRKVERNKRMMPVGFAALGVYMMCRTYSVFAS